MKIKINKKLIITLIIVILFSILRYIYVNNLLDEISLYNKYSLLSFQFADKFLLLVYFPIYIFVIVGELKQYDNAHYISRFNNLNSYNYYILKNIITITFKYIIILSVVNFVEANLTINNLTDVYLHIKYLLFLLNLFLAYIVAAYIYIFIYNLLNEVFAIFSIIILNMLEFLRILNGFLFNRIFNDFGDANFYYHQVSIMIYLLILFAFIYLINNALTNNIDIQRGNYEQ